MNRSFDAARVNELVNHPEIRPHVGGDGASVLDLTDAVLNNANWFILGEHGGFGCIWSAPGVYEAHTFILPSGRGKWARRAASTGFAMMREAGAWMIWTRVHPEAANVRQFTLQCGFKRAGTNAVAGVDYDIFCRRF